MENLLKQLILCSLMLTVSMTSLFSQNDTIEYEARLGNTTPGKIELADFIAQEGLSIAIINSDTPADFSVISYEITILSKEEDPTSTINKGGEFSSESRVQINRLKKGDTIYLDKILGIKSRESKETKFASLVFKVI